MIHKKPSIPSFENCCHSYGQIELFISQGVVTPKHTSDIQAVDLPLIVCGRSSTQHSDTTYTFAGGRRVACGDVRDQQLMIPRFHCAPGQVNGTRGRTLWLSMSGDLLLRTISSVRCSSLPR